MKPENTEIRILEDEVEFDGKVVKKIKYDLKHINQGWNDKARDYKTRIKSKKSLIMVKSLGDLLQQLWTTIMLK